MGWRRGGIRKTSGAVGTSAGHVGQRERGNTGHANTLRFARLPPKSRTAKRSTNKFPKLLIVYEIKCPVIGYTAHIMSVSPSNDNTVH